MKYISSVEIDERKMGPSRNPRTDIRYGCMLSTNNAQQIDEELDEAVALAPEVTWILDREGSIWKGAIYSADPDKVEVVRKYLVETKGWRQMELSFFEDTSDKKISN